MQFVFDDGGRSAAGFKGMTGDCATRAVAIVTGLPYQQVYDGLNELAKSERIGKRKKKISNSRTGVYPQTVTRFLDPLGWHWVPTMHIGSGCTKHLVADELPGGTLLLRLSRHFTSVVDGVIHDTYDPSREEHWTEPYREPIPKGYWTHDNISMHHVVRRCVYGYWFKPDH